MENSKAFTIRKRCDNTVQALPYINSQTARYKFLSAKELAAEEETATVIMFISIVVYY